MSTLRVTIRVPRKTLQRAKYAVRRVDAPSLNEYVVSALEQKATLDELDDVLSEMLEESGGPMTAAEGKRIDRLLVRSTRKRKAKN